MKKNLLIELLETGEKVLEKKKIITIIGTNLNGPLEITITSVRDNELYLKAL